LFCGTDIDAEVFDFPFLPPLPLGDFFFAGSGSSCSS